MLKNKVFESHLFSQNLTYSNMRLDNNIKLFYTYSILKLIFKILSFFG